MHKTLTDLSFTKLLKLRINVLTWKNLFANSDTSTSTCNIGPTQFMKQIFIYYKTYASKMTVLQLSGSDSRSIAQLERGEECVKRYER